MLNDVKSALFLFYKYITRGNKWTLVLTILVTILAFIEINFISGILSGAVALTYKQAQDVYISNIVIQPGKDATGKSEDYTKQVNLLKNKIYSIPVVIDCCSRYSTGAIITYDPDKTGKDVRSISWPVKSINRDEEIKVIDIHKYMVDGQYLEDTDRDQIIMGREISGGYGAAIEVQTLKGANIGDEVTVYYHNGVVRDYKIKGIYATAFPFADMTIFVTQKEMESVLGLRDRASEILVKTSPEYSQQYYISELSGGEQQRVAIARALVNKSKILFADEPCASLDSENKGIVLRLLRQLCDDLGQTILMVTHEPDQREFTDRVIWLRDGLIEKEETISEDVREHAVHNSYSVDVHV